MTQMYLYQIRGYAFESYQFLLFLEENDDRYKTKNSKFVAVTADENFVFIYR